MPVYSVKVIRQEQDAARRLSDFGLSSDVLICVANAARTRADDATESMPLNAPGTLAYLYGVHELREQLIENGWEINRTRNIESVIHREREMRIAYQNVDNACDMEYPPNPISAKGKGAEYLNGPNLFDHAGIDPGPITATEKDGLPTYYVMVGQDGSVELSRPVISKGGYIDFIERIFVHKPAKEAEPEVDLKSGIVDDFEPDVSMKKNL